MRTCEKCGAELRNLDDFGQTLPITQCTKCFNAHLAKMPTSRGAWATKHVKLSPEAYKAKQAERQALAVVWGQKGLAD